MKFVPKLSASFEFSKLSFIHMRKYSNFKSKYLERLNKNLIAKNNDQLKVVNLLDKLHDLILSYNKDLAFKYLLELQQKSCTIDQPKGLYIWGSVGSGKSMLMDLFFENIHIERKKRVHFHKFCLDLHKRIHLHKMFMIDKYGRDININKSSERDSIIFVANQISCESILLCFDEFQVTDVADALILKKVFSQLWLNGTILIATSNRPPSDLYQNGLNREYFLPFIDLLNQYCIIRQISTESDYRLLCMKGENSYLIPANESNRQKLWNMFILSQNGDGTIHENIRIEVMMNRFLIVPFVNGRNCFLNFSDVCEKDKGAADYRALCENFDTVYIFGIPHMSILKHDIARRFITFIDEVYDSKTKLIWSGADDPSKLFKSEIVSDKELSIDDGNEVVPSIVKSSVDINQSLKHVNLNGFLEEVSILQGELSSVKELDFAFKRATSRLIEIASDAYRKENT